MQLPVLIYSDLQRNVSSSLCISDSQLSRLKEHYDKYGIFLRTHGNTKRLPSNTLPQLVTENVHNFLANYVEENAIVLPGRIPGFKSDEVKVLQSRGCFAANLFSRF